VSILDELTEGEESGAHKAPSVLDELTGLDKDDEADAAEKETAEAAKSEIGQELHVALKGNDPKAIYEAVAKVIANEG
jgi:hypothetical protein